MKSQFATSIRFLVAISTFAEGVRSCRKLTRDLRSWENFAALAVLLLLYAVNSSFYEVSAKRRLDWGLSNIKLQLMRIMNCREIAVSLVTCARIDDEQDLFG